MSSTQLPPPSPTHSSTSSTTTTTTTTTTSISAAALGSSTATVTNSTTSSVTVIPILNQEDIEDYQSCTPHQHSSSTQQHSSLPHTPLSHHQTLSHPSLPHHSIQTIYLILPKEVVRYILSFFAFPDLEYHPTIAAKMDAPRSAGDSTLDRFALSTTNQVLYTPKHLLNYYYGYFGHDEQREIFLLNQSLKICCGDNEQASPNKVPFASVLPCFGNLKKLNLFKVSLTINDLSLLPKTLNFVSIMTSTEIDMELFDIMLDTLPKLSSLQFQSKMSDNKAIVDRVFHKMCRLKSVSILCTRLTDKQASIFMNPRSNGGCNRIEQLSLVNCGLTQNCLTVLSSNTTLKCLRISRNQIGDEGCAKIRKCANLLELSVDQCNITGKGVNYVAKLPLVRRLWIRQNTISSGFGQIATANHLQILNFHDNQGMISVPMCRAMAKCASVHTLVMNKCRLTDAHIVALLNKNNTLRRLYINWNDSLTQESIKALAKNTSIYKLAYSQRTLTNDHLKFLLEHNKVLQVLNIPYSPAVTDAFLPNLAKSNTLRTLKIRQVENISSDGIEFIKKHCLSITQLFYGGEEKELYWIRPGTDVSLTCE
mmetsp:Transcript_2738/g.10534  ORF Transcript_2738/g.10534 Transcript_2738/m.10534 type:complete len:594 (-) Transcript_2738:2312-4093(-)